MVVQQAVVGVGSRIGGVFKWFFRNIKVSFLFIFFTILFINAIIIAIHDGPVAGGIYLGERFIKITDKLNQDSLKIIEQGSVYPEGAGFFKRIGSYFSVYWTFLETLMVIYMWLKVLAWIEMKILLQNDSMSTSSWTHAIIYFLLIQAGIYSFKESHIFLDGFTNFARAFPIMFKPLANIVEKIT